MTVSAIQAELVRLVEAAGSGDWSQVTRIASELSVYDAVKIHEMLWAIGTTVHTQWELKRKK